MPSGCRLSWAVRAIQARHERRTIALGVSPWPGITMAQGRTVQRLGRGARVQERSPAGPSPWRSAWAMQYSVKAHHLTVGPTANASRA